MIKYLREYPNLPLLTSAWAFEVLDWAQMGPSFISVATGYSRVAVTRWRADPDAVKNKRAMESVSTLAYRALRAAKHNKIPAKKRYGVKDAYLIGDAAYEKPLAVCTLDDVLPDSWQERFNTLREQDASA